MLASVQPWAPGMSDDLAPGFADPVLDSQRCFRALLEAMSRPGTIVVAGEAAPAPLAPATAAVLLTLVDGDVPLWLDAAAASVWPWLRLHCDAVPAATSAEARFVCALAAPSSGLPDLATLEAGSDAAPEDGATVVLQLPALGEGAAFRLSGPGIEDATTLRVRGLPPDFARRWADNHALYPRGVDLVLCAGNRLCALPRSVRVEDVP